MIQIDADGAPNAYGPARNARDHHGIGIDSLESACYPPGAADPLGQEDWQDILVPDPNDPTVPFLKPDGFYISKTTLADENKADIDEGKFLDATALPYIVMPQFWIDHMGMALGDLCVLIHSKVARPVVAIVGDFCPFIEDLGEMSVRTALAIGAHKASPRDGPLFPRGSILMRMLKGSLMENPWPLSEEKLQGMLPQLGTSYGFDPFDITSYQSGLVKVDTQ